MIFGRTKTELPTSDKALPGRDTRPFTLPATHLVLGTPLEGPTPDGYEVAVFGLRLLLGRREDVLGASGSLVHLGGVRRGCHTQPDL